jgi:DNA-binding protein
MEQLWFRNLPSALAIIVVAGSALYCFGVDPNPKVLQVTDAHASGPALRSKDEYQRGAYAILGKSILSRTKLTIDTKAFTEQFIRQYPEVAEATVSLPLVSRRPVVSIVTAQPVLLLSASPSRQVFVMDARGKAIMEARDLQSSARDKLTLVNDESGVEVDTGTTVLSPDEVSFITGVLAQLRAKQLVVSAVTLPPIAHELHIRLQGQPYYIKFNIQGDPRLAAGTFLAAKAKLEQGSITPAEYIDVRVEERAYYK